MHNGKSSRGFTLIEAAMVAAVLGALLVLSVPLFKGGILAAQQGECVSNLRQIGTALMLFANDNDGWLPGTTHELGVEYRKAWIFTLRPYLANADAVRICPADPNGPQRLKENGTSYILNSFVFVPQIGPFGERLGDSTNNLRLIPRPSKTLLAANISDEQGVGVQSDHTHSEQWGGDERHGGNWARLCADIQPDRFTLKPAKDHAEGSANYLFADGHVENIPAQVVRDRLDRGDNIARPPR